MITAAVVLLSFIALSAKAADVTARKQASALEMEEKKNTHRRRSEVRAAAKAALGLLWDAEDLSYEPKVQTAKALLGLRGCERPVEDSQVKHARSWKRGKRQSQLKVGGCPLPFTQCTSSCFIHFQQR